MRFALLISLSLLTASLAAQAPNSLNRSGLYNTLENPFLLLKQGEITAAHEVIRRLENNLAIVRKKTEKTVTNKADNSGMDHDWKWLSISETSQERLFYIRTSSSLRRINDILELWHDIDRSLSLVFASPVTINTEVIPLPFVTFIQEADRKPHTESLLRAHNLGINGIRKTHQNYPELNGESLIISVKENAFDTIDLDLAGRASWDGLSSSVVVAHATNMATLIGGRANTGKAGEGVARSTQFLSEDFQNLLPADDEAFQRRNIAIQNHSYGVGIENFYGVESVAFDQQALNLPHLLHVFSSGNLGSLNSTGDYEAIVGYRTLTGSFKQAKNVLVVTGSDSTANIPEPHSAGPAYDGRIKPELTAFGGGGTSDAAALVSGASLLLQENFHRLYEELPTIDLLKAIFIASSKEIGDTGPDFLTGYGQMALHQALDLIDQRTFLQDTLSASSPSSNRTINIPDGINELKIVLSWIDPPANDGDFYALINDLDLRVSKDGATWKPWILDHRPDVNLLSSPAITGNDTLNNIEMITIPFPEPGNYSLSVSSSSLTSDQSFSVAYYTTETNYFEWTYPTNLDAFNTGVEQFLYFDNTFTSTGTIEISAQSGSWIPIGSISPGEQFKTYIPEISGEALFRARFGEIEILSDTFAIHPKVDLVVDLLCDEEMVLSWNDAGTDSYQVSMFDGRQLTPVSLVQGLDTLIDRSIYSGTQFTVAPIFESREGLADETLNITQQGAGCYLNSFLVTLDDEGMVQLQANLSLPESIATLNIIKSDQQGSVVLLDVTPDQDRYQIEDPSPLPGRTIYQVRLVTHSGLAIASEVVEIFTTDDTQYILFPNPVINGQLSLLSPTTDAIFQIIDSNARIVSNFLISAEAETFPVDGLNGVYYYRVIKEGKVVKSGRFIVSR